MDFLLDLALILVFAKLFGEFFERLGLPELLGAIIAGFMLGPLLGLVEIGNIASFGQVGLVLLLFTAGFGEVNIDHILKDKKSALINGFVGAVVPLLAGYYLAQAFGFDFGASVFIGTALAATSLTISLGSFISAGKLNTRAGRTILGSAIIDDVAGLLFLAFAVSMAATGSWPGVTEIFEVVFGIASFAAAFMVVALLSPLLIAYSKKFAAEEAQFSLAIVLVLVLAFLADKLGLSTVLGAFLAGVVLSRTSLGTKAFQSKLDVISEGFFIPVFFAWVGLQIIIDSSALSWFTLALVVVAVLSKLVPSYLASRLLKMTHNESMAIGWGMVPRGEVTMVVLVLGASLGFVSPKIFSSFLILIFVTVFLAPILLAPVLKSRLPA